MASVSLFLLLSLLSIISFPASIAQEFLHATCDNGNNFAANSTYQTNLNTLIQSLATSAPATGFAMDHFGQNPDTVFGLAICRGDINAADCRSCLNESVKDAAAKCPGNKAGNVFYAICHFRYSDQNFLGTFTGPLFSLYNVNNVSDAASFNRSLGRLLDNLTERAAASERKFAADSVDFTDFQRIYALVQCTRDLSSEACSACLITLIAYIPTCCAAKQGGRVFGSSCYLNYEVVPFFNATAAAEPPPFAPTPSPNSYPPPLPDFPAEDNKSSNIVIAIGVLVAGVVLLLIFTAIWICLRQKRKSKHVGRRQEDDANQSFSFHYSLQVLKVATMNFSDQNKLGKGGFGVVYKGVLGDGQLIAVKRLVTNSHEGLKELQNEVYLVAELQHRNLVRLLGYCLEAQEKILVYEYLPNKSLDKVLFDPIRSKVLTWEKRLRIIEGVARGLLYLHEDSRLKIIHRDLKASNVLLDEDMNPKIADFGLARLFGNEQSYGSTQRIAGTHGYMAPEYMINGQISTKSDVYSFGVLLLEIITGKKCLGFHGTSPPRDLISYVRRHWDKENPLEVLDRRIKEGSVGDEALRLINIGLLCVKVDPLERPNMAHVVLLLSSSSTSLPALSPQQGLSGMSSSVGDPFEDPVPSPVRSRRFSVATDSTTLEPR